MRYQRPDGYYTVYIRVIHNRKIQYIKTDKVVNQKGIDKNNYVCDPFVMKYCADKIALYTELLNKQDVKDWDVNEIVSYLIKGSSDLCFSDYAREYQSKMIRDGHARNARTYELAYQNLERFIGTTKVMFSYLTSTVITRWISSLSKTARAKEQYPVCVRQIFKQALLDYNDYDGIIGYERRKTRDARKDNAWFEIRVPDIVKPIMEKYLDTSGSEFLFNFHARHSTYDSFNANVNIGIRQICEKVLKLKKEDYYSGYTFRHTWATVAQNECDATLAEVDFGLNHAHKTQLARTYVKIDFTPAWELNEKVVEKIFFTEDKTSANKNEESESNLFRFSAKQLIKGTLYFKGKILASVEDIGFNNIEEVISHLMKNLPDTIPSRSMVLIRIENRDKGQKQDFTKLIR